MIRLIQILLLQVLFAFSWSNAFDSLQLVFKEGNGNTSISLKNDEINKNLTEIVKLLQKPELFEKPSTSLICACPAPKETLSIFNNGKKESFCFYCGSVFKYPKGVRLVLILDKLTDKQLYNRWIAVKSKYKGIEYRMGLKNAKDKPVKPKNIYRNPTEGFYWPRGGGVCDDTRPNGIWSISYEVPENTSKYGKYSPKVPISGFSIEDFVDSVGIIEPEIKLDIFISSHGDSIAQCEISKESPALTPYVSDLKKLIKAKCTYFWPKPQIDFSIIVFNYFYEN
jgi:hypothetical protein